jgi:threonine aldolase
MIDVRPETTATEIARRVAERGVLVSVWSARRVRVVTHIDVTRAQAEEAAAVMRAVLAS